MVSTATTQTLSPEEILSRESSETEFLKFPEQIGFFKERGTRFRQLSANHPMRDFLLLMARVCEAQQLAFNQPRDSVLPSVDELGEAARQGIPPLTLDRWPLPQNWQEELQSLINNLLTTTEPGLVRDVLVTLQQSGGDALQQQAQCLLTGDTADLNLAGAPFIAAALQVFYVRLVQAVHQAQPNLAFGRIDDPRVCPCCGSRPVASVSRLGAEAGTRYLHCSLCQTEWHMVRIQCSHCESSKNIAYQSLDAEAGADLPAVGFAPGTVRAEVCEDCNHYLKIMAMDKDPHVDPVADDIASLALDLLLSDVQKIRHGLNLLLPMGDSNHNNTPAAGAS